MPVVQAMARQASGPIDLGIWGTVAVSLAYSNLAREVWLEAGLDPHVPTFTTILQCCTSMAAAFQAAAFLGRPGLDLALVGGSETASRVQIGLSQAFSVGLRRVLQARSAAKRLAALRAIRPRDIRLYVPQIKNRATGKSMGEHCEEMAKEWKIGRPEQDEYALESHRRAVAAQEAGFPQDLVPVDGLERDQFPAPRHLAREAREAPARLRPRARHDHRGQQLSADRRRRGHLGRDGRRSRAPSATTPRVRLVDFEMAAVDIFHEGLLMAPVVAIPRLLARNGLKYEDVALWEIHEAFAAQVLCNVKGLEDAEYVREHARACPTRSARFPRERMNPNGGSVALGHPFAATGARILSQAVRELAAMPKGSRAIVSVCADGGLGTVALLET